MIKWTFLAATCGIGIAFAAGAYVGWKTTLFVLDNVEKRHSKGS